MRKGLLPVLCIAGAYEAPAYLDDGVDGRLVLQAPGDMAELCIRVATPKSTIFTCGPIKDRSRYV